MNIRKLSLIGLSLTLLQVAPVQAMQSSSDKGWGLRIPALATMGALGCFLVGVAIGVTGKEVNKRKQARTETPEPDVCTLPRPVEPKPTKITLNINGGEFDGITVRCGNCSETSDIDYFATQKLIENVLDAKPSIATTALRSDTKKILRQLW